MKFKNLILTGMAGCGLLADINSVRAQGTAFTYQGRLNDANGPATGIYDLQFTLYATNATGVAVAGPVTNNATAVSNGLFVAAVNFGPGVFTGTNLWLDIAARTNGAATFIELMPRQPITPTPYAIFAGSASNLVGTVAAAQLSGTIPLAQLPGAVLTNNESSVTLSNVTLSGKLTLPGTTATIFSGSSGLLYSGGLFNFSAGLGAMPANAGEANTAVGDGALFNNAVGVQGGYENTALGENAMNANTGGSYDTAVGYNAMGDSPGSPNLGYNTAIGWQALLEDTTGINNVAIGYGTMLSNSSGSGNAANGYQALYYNGSGNNNTANGYEALIDNTSGSNNVANGFLALQSSKTNSGNAAYGGQALANLTAGGGNLAMGYQAGLDLTNGVNNIYLGNPGTNENGVIRIGVPGIQTNTVIAGVLNGNGGGLTNLNLNGQTLSNLTVSGSLTLPSTTTTVYSGTSLLFHADEANPGYVVVPGDFFAGLNAGNLTMSGVGNTAIGGYSLFNNTSGSFNMAIGQYALFANTSGSFNSASGNSALISNTNGSYNTANGANALLYNASGSNNVAVGYGALQNAPGDSDLVAIGFQALQNDNAFGYNGTVIPITGANTAVGYQALQLNTFGYDNAAIGYQALQHNTHGVENTACGYLALYNNSTGTNNIALGSGAGQLTTGNNNIEIGNAGVSGENNTIRIGDPNFQTATYLAGTTYVQILAITSDRNAKENFGAINPRDVLAKVAALPVTEWNYKMDRKDQQHIGPMAQDFQAAFGLNGQDDKHISMADEGGVALAAIQGLNQKLEDENAELKRQNDSLAKRLSDLEQAMQTLNEKK